MPIDSRKRPLRAARIAFLRSASANLLRVDLCEPFLEVGITVDRTLDRSTAVVNDKSDVEPGLKIRNSSVT